MQKEGGAPAQWRLSINDEATTDDLVRMELFADARRLGESHTATVMVDDKHPVEAWLSPDMAVVRTARYRSRKLDHTVARGSTYARGPRGALLVRDDRGVPGTQLTAVAGSREDAMAILEEAMRRVPAPPPATDNRVRFHLWHRGMHGAQRVTRRLEVEPWETIGRNYPAGVRAQLDQLMARPAPAGGGKLVLWHGAPGTGKTTALRSLADAWREWCDVHYVSDAERMFDDLDYLHSVVGGFEMDDPFVDDSRRQQTRWRLVVAEDSDEYLRADARQSAGASLGRLLNVTDGILGQGLRTLVLLTTNEPLSALHPAVVRPGRCLADVEFAPFSGAEAREWWGGPVPGSPTRVTLAELYEKRGGLDRISNVDDEPVAIGSYL